MNRPMTHRSVARFYTPRLLMLLAVLVLAFPARGQTEPMVTAYTATMITERNGLVSTSQIWQSGERLRIEVLGGRLTSVMIVDYGTGSASLLIPGEMKFRRYAIADLNAATPHFFDPRTRIDYDAGVDDSVDGIAARRYRVRISSRGKSYQGILWEATSTPGIPLRWETSEPRSRVSWQDGHREEVAERLFRIPAGYTAWASLPEDEHPDCVRRHLHKTAAPAAESTP